MAEVDKFKKNRKVEEDKFTCRMCGKVRDADEGDDTIDVCDDCLEGYDMDKFWNDFEKGKIPEDELKIISLEPYLEKKAESNNANSSKRMVNEKLDDENFPSYLSEQGIKAERRRREEIAAAKTVESRQRLERVALEKLKKLVQVSEKLKISQMAKILKLSEEDLYDRIVDWAAEFGFILDEDIVKFSAGRKDDFIASLDQAFAEWGLKSASKDGKA